MFESLSGAFIQVLAIETALSKKSEISTLPVGGLPVMLAVFKFGIQI